MKRGLVQIYTGNGKGKTTAAIGLAVRAAGAGLRVCIAQFLKPRASCEIKVLRERFPEIQIECSGRRSFIIGKPTRGDRTMAQALFLKVLSAVESANYDVVIADELNVAVKLGLISANQVLEMLRKKPKGVEILLTGRDADPQILAAADLVTEMREIKHYFAAGVPARRGIEA